MSKKRIDSITKEKDENRYRGGLLAVSFTTGMVGAARFGNAEKAAGRWYMQQSLRKSGENVSLSLSASPSSSGSLSTCLLSNSCIYLE